MQGSISRSGRGSVRKALLASILLTFSLSRGTVGDVDSRSSCEARAWQAYFQALKRCELAENTNPRLRCYEEARAVFLRTLLECKEER